MLARHKGIEPVEITQGQQIVGTALEAGTSLLNLGADVAVGKPAGKGNQILHTQLAGEPLGLRGPVTGHIALGRHNLVTQIDEGAQFVGRSHHRPQQPVGVTAAGIEQVEPLLVEAHPQHTLHHQLVEHRLGPVRRGYLRTVLLGEGRTPRLQLDAAQPALALQKVETPLQPQRLAHKCRLDHGPPAVYRLGRQHMLHE